jgi:hypothetical protein
MQELKQGGLKGQIQVYLHCFNLDIIGTGTVTPEGGVKFPGGYKATDPGLTFPPYMTYGNPDIKVGMAHNSKYVGFFLMFLLHKLLMVFSLLRLHQVHPSMPASTSCLLVQDPRSKKGVNTLPHLRRLTRI